MAATKDSTESVKKTKPVVTEEMPAVQPVAVTEPAVKPAAKKPLSTQTVITIAIISGVVVFFLGLGLGYMLGHAGTSSRTMPGNGTMQPPPNGGGRRSMPNSGTDDTTDNSKSDTKTQTN